MGIFSTIKDAIFGHPAAAQPAPPTQSQAPTATAAPTPAAPAPAPAAAPVDVDASLAAMAKEHGGDLNYKTSIVDLMKLVGMQSSLDERKTLAREMGYTGELDGSAEMNIWLHERVMGELKGSGTPRS